MTSTLNPSTRDKGGPGPDPAPHGKCWQCHYDLRGIDSGRCPECGWPYELTDVLSTPIGKRLMKPTRWVGRGAIAIAAIPLVFDALLAPTPLTLLLLAFLWPMAAGPYFFRSRQRKRVLFRRYPQNLLVDPDARASRRIASLFLPEPNAFAQSVAIFFNTPS